MAQALTPPFCLAALVLCLAGAGKLRSPQAAAGAASALGLPSSGVAVRTLALLELILGGLGLVHPSRLAAGAIGCLYLIFCGLSLALVRRRADCGCFGQTAAPASGVGGLLSALLAAVAIIATALSAHGLGWVFGRPAAQAGVLLLSLAASAYGVVLVYTELPGACAAWSGG